MRSKYIQTKDVMLGTRSSKLIRARQFISEDEYKMKISGVIETLNKVFEQMNTLDSNLNVDFNEFTQYEKEVNEKTNEMIKYIDGVLHGENDLEKIKRIVQNYVNEYVAKFKNKLSDMCAVDYTNRFLYQYMYKTLEEYYSINQYDELMNSRAKITKVVTDGKGNFVALKENGTVWVSGNNGNGELGLGNTNPTEIGQFVQTNLSNITDIEVEEGGFLVTDSSGNKYRSGIVYDFKDDTIIKRSEILGLAHNDYEKDDELVEFAPGTFDCFVTPDDLEVNVSEKPASIFDNLDYFDYEVVNAQSDGKTVLTTDGLKLKNSLSVKKSTINPVSKVNSTVAKLSAISGITKLDDTSISTTAKTSVTVDENLAGVAKIKEGQSLNIDEETHEVTVTGTATSTTEIDAPFLISKFKNNYEDFESYTDSKCEIMEREENSLIDTYCINTGTVAGTLDIEFYVSSIANKYMGHRYVIYSNRRTIGYIDTNKLGTNGSGTVTILSYEIDANENKVYILKYYPFSSSTYTTIESIKFNNTSVSYTKTSSANRVDYSPKASLAMITHDTIKNSIGFVSANRTGNDEKFKYFSTLSYSGKFTSFSFKYSQYKNIESLYDPVILVYVDGTFNTKISGSDIIAIGDEKENEISFTTKTISIERDENEHNVTFFFINDKNGDSISYTYFKDFMPYTTEMNKTTNIGSNFTSDTDGLKLLVKPVEGDNTYNYESGSCPLVLKNTSVIGRATFQENIKANSKYRLTFKGRRFDIIYGAGVCLTVGTTDGGFTPKYDLSYKIWTEKYIDFESTQVNSYITIYLIGNIEVRDLKLYEEINGEYSYISNLSNIDNSKATLIPATVNDDGYFIINKKLITFFENTELSGKIDYIYPDGIGGNVTTYGIYNTKTRMNSLIDDELTDHFMKLNGSIDVNQYYNQTSRVKRFMFKASVSDVYLDINTSVANSLYAIYFRYSQTHDWILQCVRQVLQAGHGSVYIDRYARTTSTSGGYKAFSVSTGGTTSPELLIIPLNNLAPFKVELYSSTGTMYAASNKSPDINASHNLINVNNTMGIMRSNTDPTVVGGHLKRLISNLAFGPNASLYGSDNSGGIVSFHSSGYTKYYSKYGALYDNGGTPLISFYISTKCKRVKFNFYCDVKASKTTVTVYTDNGWQSCNPKRYDNNNALFDINLDNESSASSYALFLIYDPSHTDNTYRAVSFESSDNVPAFTAYTSTGRNTITTSEAANIFTNTKTDYTGLAAMYHSQNELKSYLGFRVKDDSYTKFSINMSLDNTRTVRRLISQGDSTSPGLCEYVSEFNNNEIYDLKLYNFLLLINHSSLLEKRYAETINQIKLYKNDGTTITINEYTLNDYSDIIEFVSPQNSVIQFATNIPNAFGYTIDDLSTIDKVKMCYDFTANNFTNHLMTGYIDYGNNVYTDLLYDSEYENGNMYILEYDSSIPKNSNSKMVFIEFFNKNGYDEYQYSYDKDNMKITLPANIKIVNPCENFVTELITKLDTANLSSFHIGSISNSKLFLDGILYSETLSDKEFGSDIANRISELLLISIIPMTSNYYTETFNLIDRFFKNLSGSTIIELPKYPTNDVILYLKNFENRSVDYTDKNISIEYLTNESINISEITTGELGNEVLKRAGKITKIANSGTSGNDEIYIIDNTDVPNYEKDTLHTMEYIPHLEYMIDEKYIADLIYNIKNSPDTFFIENNERVKKIVIYKNTTTPSFKFKIDYDYSWIINAVKNGTIIHAKDLQGKLCGVAYGAKRRTLSRNLSFKKI